MKISEILPLCNLTRETEISFGYKYEAQNFILDFYQNSIGQNILEQYARKIKGVWVNLTATNKEIQLMWAKLNETEFHDDSELRKTHK
jgi:hypothetical protein